MCFMLRELTQLGVDRHPRTASRGSTISAKIWEMRSEPLAEERGKRRQREYGLEGTAA